MIADLLWMRCGVAGVLMQESVIGAPTWVAVRRMCGVARTLSNSVPSNIGIYWNGLNIRELCMCCTN